MDAEPPQYGAHDPIHSAAAGRRHEARQEAREDAKATPEVILARLRDMERQVAALKRENESLSRSVKELESFRRNMHGDEDITVADGKVSISGRAAGTTGEFIEHDVSVDGDPWLEEIPVQNARPNP